MVITETTFKNSPVLEFRDTPDSKFPYILGAKKLRAILENLEPVQAFVEKHTGVIA